MNNNNQTFEDDAVIDSGMRHTPPPLYTPRTGQFAKLSYGRYDPRKDDDYEETPLLTSQFDHENLSEDGLPASEEEPSESWQGEKDFEGKTWWRKPSAYWLLPPFLLFTLAFGGLMVPKLNLILSLVCQTYLADKASADPTFTYLPVIVSNDNEQCRIPEVQALVTRFNLYGQIIGGILSAITSPRLGALSDRYGRLRVIAFTTCGMFMGEIITIIAATWPAKFSVNWLLLGYATDGLCGSFIAAMAVAHAYASDCTAPSKRAVTFGYFHGCLFLGIAVGPAIAAAIIKATGEIITIFYVALCSHFIFIFLLVFVLPESLTKERQLAAREKKAIMDANTPPMVWTFVSTIEYIIRAGGLFAPLKILWPTGPGSSRAVRRNLISLAAVDTTMFGVAMGSMSIVILYSGYKFAWGTVESSLFTSIINSCRVAVLLVVLPLLGRIFRGKASGRPTKNTGADRLDLNIIRSAIVFDMLGYVGYAVAASGGMLTAAGAIASLGGMGSPTMQSALTKHVPADRTGQLLGAMGLLHALARVVAPAIFNSIYAWTVGTMPTTVFICLASTFGAAFVMSWFIKPGVYYDEPSEASIASSMMAESSDEEVVIR